MTIKAMFDGQVFVPRTPIDLPPGCEVEISVALPSEPPRDGKTLADLAEFAAKLSVDPNLPKDLAAQHDHYLYGTPKRP